MKIARRIAVIGVIAISFASSTMLAGHKAWAQAPSASSDAASVPPRLYIHLQDASQAAAADRLRGRLKGASLSGMKITTMEPTIDAPPSIKAAQLRCVTRKDCALISELAGLLDPLLAAPPKTTDLSVRFDGKSGTRQYHYEIWFPPGPIVFRRDAATPPPINTASSSAALPMQASPAATSTPSPTRKTAATLDTGNVKIPFSYELSGPATIEEGGIVALAFTRPAGADRTYSVTIDGVPAATRETPLGLEVTVPKLSRNLLSRRRVAMDVLIGPGLRLGPSPRLLTASMLSDWSGWLAGLATLATAAGIAGFLGRNIFNVRLREASTIAFEAGAHRLEMSDVTRDVATQILAASSIAPAMQRIGDIDVPSELIEACAHHACLLFVGGDGNQLRGVVSHATVLSELLTKSRQLGSSAKIEGTILLEGGDLDTIADLLADRMGRTKLVAALAQQFAPGAATDEVPQQFARIGFAGAVTSLFANTAERAWPDAVHLTPKANYDFAGLIRERNPFVLRLRGNWDEPASVNLTGFEMGRAIEESPGLREVLSGLFAARTVLFVGLDAAALGVALETGGIRMATGQRHFALVQDTAGFDISAERFARQYGITFIRVYGADDVSAVLDDLAQKVAAAKGTSSQSENMADAPPEQARISNVKLVNIGPFEKLEVDFRAPWTVLLGNNGAGKSTILRAIALALSGNDETVRDAARSLLRRGEKSGSIEITLENGRTPVTYQSLLIEQGGRLGIRAATAPLQSGTIPVFGFPAVRGIAVPGTVDMTRDDSYPHPRVADVLPIISGGPDERGRGLKQWIFRSYLRSLDEHLPQSERDRSKAQIQSVFAVIDSMTPGFDLRFSRCDADISEVLLMTSDGEMPMDYISQGMSSTLSWIGPMIQRLFEIGKTADNAHAILLIDEIDSHLHPAWQQRLVESLKKHFPNVQVIATTHSPLMVGNLGENEVLRVVRGENALKVEYLEQSFIGYRFDQILTDEAFGLARARSPQWKAREQYAALLGKSKREPAEEAEFSRLAKEIEKLPGPSETPGERRAADVAERELQIAIRAAADGQQDTTDFAGKKEG